MIILFGQMVAITHSTIHRLVLASVLKLVNLLYILLTHPHIGVLPPQVLLEPHIHLKLKPYNIQSILLKLNLGSTNTVKTLLVVIPNQALWLLTP